MPKKKNYASALCAMGILAGCAPSRYTYYEPVAVNARYAPGLGCAGPHNLAVFPLDRHGVQLGVVVNNYSSPQELWFELRDDRPTWGFAKSEEWKAEDRLMREHIFDVFSADPVLQLTFSDGSTTSFSIPFLEGQQHRSYNAWKIDGTLRARATWRLPPKALNGFDVRLPEILVDGQRIPTSPIHFRLKTEVIFEGINC